MNFTYKKVTTSDKDFASLVQELNSSLRQITDDSGESSFSPDEFNSQLDGCMVVCLDNQPVACGVFRYFSDGVCELKRMYSKQPKAGAFILNLLEEYAATLGYQKAILSTRRVNLKAVRFYQRNGYKECAPYGKYIGVSRSICLSKPLSK
ncbi:GNAT family N-acetyltransferase [Vibrio europaeus]|uniref:GNAT family N-acetyltransferase n=1 Tax=Vibrio europaeus TaxID=300876 RepID=UPI0018A7C8ED|nr:GNAT family N-acetyltransferase [Vibrio europaeus]MDC5806502.1 GNAT family N-acetyltransferase [Vibrio europaeus]MDC5812805.1 GNAT family N-acetyltransferase [Vibrio europaeus]MDC5824117.1 GNAT family N-acetyltransferase [Vibrio europaeus]MDC5829872.1 GNAT family N-acetyltransferase [Vibrio europaeus]MDC5836727.1 GNAT family N-acetyltransferase [Vibrio europaeus]